MLKKISEYLRKNEEAHKSIKTKIDAELNKIINISPFPNELRLEIATCGDGVTQLEVLNDDTTTMDFVVRLFEELGFTNEKSEKHMFNIHNEGRAIILTSNERNTLKVASFIEEQACQNGYPLKCRIKNITKT